MINQRPLIARQRAQLGEGTNLDVELPYVHKERFDTIVVLRLVQQDEFRVWKECGIANQIIRMDAVSCVRWL